MNSIKEYQAKIKKLEKELEKLREKYSTEKGKNKKLRQGMNRSKQRVRDLAKSRDAWKGKLRSKQLTIKGLKKRIERSGKAKRHRYGTWLVGLCILLRVRGGCSYGSIRRILEILDTCFQLGLDKVPCENTVQNWVSKMGLFFMGATEKTLKGKQVSLIIDESIRLGQEKLLLILGVPFNKAKQSALRFEDISVLYMKGAKSWTGEKISRAVAGLRQSHGFDLKNILSDEDSKLLKACRLLRTGHVPDIGHAVASCLRRVFGQTVDFRSFKKLVSSYSSKGVNQPLSYLRPPKQRTKARFMNLDGVVAWAKKMLERFGSLNGKEKAFFAELPGQREIISSLGTCLSAAKEISMPFKKDGLSKGTLEQARRTIRSMAAPSGYLKAFLKEMEGYLAQYQAFMDEHGGTAVHASSEIIESMFGKYKSKANNYALTGLTTLNLELPIYGRKQNEISSRILEALEDISLAELGKWKKDNSADNQIVKRTNFFKNKK
ncbi:MAG TPA: hypothetical protein ENJ95_10945 [Bacteroidetes bacterium]|nr:hypothetical protein [Bacteroidota bacterium]